MFTLDQIKSAHAKVASGADFRRYIQDIIQLGVTGYETFVTDSHSIFLKKMILKSSPKESIPL